MQRVLVDSTYWCQNASCVSSLTFYFLCNQKRTAVLRLCCSTNGARVRIYIEDSQERGRPFSKQQGTNRRPPPLFLLPRDVNPGRPVRNPPSGP